MKRLLRAWRAWRGGVHVDIRVTYWGDHRQIGRPPRAERDWESEWRDRVAANPTERARLGRWTATAAPMLLRRQAE